jgi:phage repressor protein C with HTH and peptisase S24 domain
MAGDVSAVSRRLKEIRRRVGLSIREVAEALGMEHGSSYQHYEDRYRKPLLPLDLTQKLVPIFAKAGADPAELYALAGVDASGSHLLGVKPAEDDPRIIRVGELDIRAGAALTGETETVIDTWQIPAAIIRAYSSAPASDLRIIAVMGDSMEPTLQPGQRILVDTGDTKPSPPGIFVVWDGQGLVVRRVALLPHSDPARVKITCDNPKYDPSERTIDEAHIRGRVIGQWRWL